MKQVYNIVWPREYKTGSGTKTSWGRVGVLLIDGDKISLRLDAIPVGPWDGWLRAYQRDDDRRRDDFEDDIPF